MKAKLIKREDGLYFLHDENGKLIYGKLSLKNCQAIERGYDLDELVNDYDIRRPFMRIDKKHQKMYKEGFQKALEILGDKKFSEEDFKKIIHWSTLDEDVRLSEEELFKSLQQTEWGVEIEMICPHPEDTYRCGLQYGCDTECYHPNKIPYLDSEGCLILKKINL
jgi:hypothetical protein